MARLSQQTEGFSRLVVRAQEQSQTLAQQASQAAANAQAAAQQRDLAKQDQSNSEAQAQLVRQQAAAEQQKADQATQQVEKYRQEREAELAQLQQALGQIAETRRTTMGLMLTLASEVMVMIARVTPEPTDSRLRLICCTPSSPVHGEFLSNQSPRTDLSESRTATSVHRDGHLSQRMGLLTKNRHSTH